MKHNINKNFGFDSLIGKHAKNQFKLWHFSKEWRAGIIILSLFKTATWVISVYAGYYFLYNVSLPVIGSENTAIITSLVLLVGIELLTWFFLAKFFKFLLKGIITTAVFSGVIAGGIYFLSFHMSTNGLAMRQSDKIDKTTIITKNKAIDLKTIDAKYNNRIKHYYTEINRIQANPQGWIGGKREVLTAIQLADIKMYNLKIDSLDRQSKHDKSRVVQKQNALLKQNNVKTTAEANRYYNYVIAIMVAQFIFNGLLMFSWSRIYNENDRLAVVSEDIAMAENTIVENMFKHVATRLFNDAARIQAAIEHQAEKPIESFKNNQPQPDEIPIPEIPIQVAGFKNNAADKTESPDKETDSSNKETDSSNIGFKRGSNTSSNTTQPPVNQAVNKSDVLGKLKTNDMLRYCIRKKDEGELDWKEKQILAQCNAKRWKLYEFKNMMITAGLINEPDKYK